MHVPHRLPTPVEERPTASGSGTAGGANLPTDFDAINDAVVISGVDIAVRLASFRSLDIALLSV